MVSIILNCGRKVYTDGFYLGNTYGEYLHGSPHETMNKSVFERTTYPSNWGHRKCIKLIPTKHEFENKLKPFYFAVWMHSAPINSDFHGSELVVIWFEDLPYNYTVSDIIQNGVKNIDWNEYAVDFHY